jgi:hypothetical protein
MSAPRTIALPTVEEVLGEIDGLLAASGELAPRRAHDFEGELLDVEMVPWVLSALSPAWSNIDFEPQLGRLEELERKFVERQIERTHREYQLEPSRPSPWVLSRLSLARLTDSSIRDREEPWIVLCLEVPVLTIDRRRAVLRGQRNEATYAEDFEHWLEKVEGRWTLTP